ncbi:MAG: hypothetical protein KatS3mg068_0596 [Candidatus Sericytochromatia bacterium]|nr:MAG: hypothetical protein KatS3mg068_0596 [Candidatus Sericytochromatia bacterium]
MKKIILVSLTILLCINLKSYSNEEEFNKYLDKSRNSSKKLLGTLKKTLEENLKAGDTLKAINVCSNIAQNIADKISNDEKIYIKRVSLKYRNLKNKPDNFEKEKLEIFEKMKKENKLKPNTEIFQNVIENNKKYFRYMKPIIANKTCLQCHGNETQIKPSVMNFLKSKYPNDLAINHKDGDIRGAVSIKIDLNNE